MTERKPIESLCVTSVIIVEVVRGKGTSDSPMRTVKQVWTTDGHFIMEHDSYQQEIDELIIDDMATWAFNECGKGVTLTDEDIDKHYLEVKARIEEACS